MKKWFFIFYVVLGTSGLFVSAQAQDFNSRSEHLLSTQVSTLRNLLGSALQDMQHRMAEMQKELDKFHACAMQKKMYAPSAETADEQGCVKSGLSVGDALPMAPSCPVSARGILRASGDVVFHTGVLQVKEGRLVVFYSDAISLTTGMCGGKTTVTCTRIYDGTDFSPCACTSTSGGSGSCGGGRGNYDH